MTVHDNHVHFHEGGLGRLAARVFRTIGGTSMTVVTTYSRSIEPWNYELLFRMTTEQEAAVRSEEVATLLALGPHPNSLIEILNHTRSLERAAELQRAGFVRAFDALEAQQAECLGEIGLATNYDRLEHRLTHLIPTLRELEQTILREAFVRAAELEVPVMLHTPTASPDSLAQIAKWAKEAGLSTDRVIQHFSKPFLDPQENHGILPSIVCHSSNIHRLLKHPGLTEHPFLLETDYMDLHPFYEQVCPIHQTVRVMYELEQSGRFSADQLTTMFDRTIERIYRVQPGVRIRS